MLSDPIADMLTRIRNANLAGHDRVAMPASKVKAEIARVLQDEGYIESFGLDEVDGHPQLWLAFKRRTAQGRPLTGLRRVSRPGLRVYRGSQSIPRVFGGLGVSVVSTSKGIMTGREARQQRLGGEVLAEVW
ncbi:MAG TPA: 30S ribosomal protein S8 [Candidatus Dormibacteraeota bacterium]